jgi:pimeloyl-ACP methyl ester carboxylesterase
MPIEGLLLQQAPVNGIGLHYARVGSGRLMLFVHGYPRHWYLWRHQLAEFGRDHCAVAVDLRGFNLSSKPEGDWNYGVRIAVEDLRGVVRTLGYERLTLVGHDWGGAIAWAFALTYPELLERLVVLSAGHPAMVDHAIRHNSEFRVRARYLLGLRHAEAPRFFASADFAALRSTCLDFPFLDEEDREAYLVAWRQPGAMEAMLATDRLEGLGPATPEAPARGNFVPWALSLVADVPALVMYTDNDPYSHPALFAGLERWAPRVIVRQFAGTHWLPEEHPALVNREIRSFARSALASRPATA